MPQTVPPALQVKVRDAYKALMQRTSGVARQGQRVMIGEIANAVCNAKKLGENASGDRMLAIQAPTGCGKTFGYGIGAIPIALANDLKVVIATATIQLQEQLLARDLAQLQAVIPEMKAVLVRGRARYVCPVRVAQVIETGSHSEVLAASGLMNQLSAGTWSGVVDELATSPAPELWVKLTNDRNGCIGRKCSAYAACPYYRARKSMEQANVFIANHDLVLADLQSGNSLLPKPEASILILDEAHHFSGKALQSLANGHALQDARTWVMRAGRLVAAVRTADRHGPLGQQAAQAMAAMELMAGTLCEAQMLLGRSGNTTDTRDERRPVRFAGGRLPSWLEAAAGECRATAEQARSQVAQLLELLQGEHADVLPPKQREQFASDVGNAVGRIDRIVSVWKLMTQKVIGGEPVAKWVEVSAGAERDIRVCASPIGVGEYLYEALWTKVAASIHLSATLTTVGGFESHLQDTGMGRVPGVRTLEVSSPFDYANQARLVVPQNVRSPRDVSGHTEDLAALIVDGVARLADGKGALCLFSSWKQLEAVEALMPRWIAERLLKQGTMGKRELLRRHEEAIQAGHTSILFGTASLEEGVDLRGDLCRLVVLAKLPFAVPSDPVSEARREHFAATERDYFGEVVVPDACRRLAQSAGRLLRSETDSGSIIVADARLTGTSYGQRMLSALPPFTLERTQLTRPPVR